MHREQNRRNSNREIETDRRQALEAGLLLLDSARAKRARERQIQERCELAKTADWERRFFEARGELQK